MKVAWYKLSAITSVLGFGLSIYSFAINNIMLNLYPLSTIPGEPISPIPLNIGYIFFGLFFSAGIITLWGIKK